MVKCGWLVRPSPCFHVSHISPVFSLQPKRPPPQRHLLNYGTTIFNLNCAWQFLIVLWNVTKKNSSFWGNLEPFFCAHFYPETSPNFCCSLPHHVNKWPTFVSYWKAILGGGRLGCRKNSGEIWRLTWQQQRPSQPQFTRIFSSSLNAPRLRVESHLDDPIEIKNSRW